MSYRYAIGASVGPWDYGTEDPSGEPLPEITDPVQDAPVPIPAAMETGLKNIGLPAAGAAAGWLLMKGKSKKLKGLAIGAATGAVLSWLIKRGTFGH